jgi:transposase-like protein
MKTAHGAKSMPSLLTATTERVCLEGDASCRVEAEAMDFSLKDYLDEDAGYRKLVELLHPAGLACPRCGQPDRLGVHSRHREPVLEYRCGHCGRVFNAWTGTILQGTHRRPCQWLLILHGVATGQPTAEMARELGCDRKHLLGLRHRLQERTRMWLDRNPLGDDVVEADEMDQNAGEKRHPAHRPDRPAPAAGQRPSGAWHLRQRPSTDRRRRRAPVRCVSFPGSRPFRQGRVGRGHRGYDVGWDGGLHR